MNEIFKPRRAAGSSTLVRDGFNSSGRPSSRLPQSPNPWRITVGFPEVFASVLFVLAAGVSYQTILENRFYVGDIPVNALDLALVLALVAGMFRIGARHQPNRLPRSVLVAILLMSFMTALAFLRGYTENYTTYNILWDFRVLAYLIISFLLFAVLLDPRFTLRVMGWLTVLGGAFVAVQFFYHFINGYSAVQSGNFAVASGEVRDSSAPIYSLPFAILILLWGTWRNRRRWQRWASYTAALILFAAMIITLARSMWLILFLALGFLSVFGIQRLRFGFLLIILGIAVLVGPFLLQSFKPTEAMAYLLQERLGNVQDFIQGSEEKGGPLTSRVNEMAVAIKDFESSPLIGRGLGLTFTTYLEEDRTFQIANFMHNSVLYYLSKMGILGLAAVLWFCGLCMKRAWNIPRQSQYFVQSRVVFSGLLGFMIVGNFSGNLNHAPIMVFWGTYFAQCVVLSQVAKLEQGGNHTLASGVARAPSRGRNLTIRRPVLAP